MNFDAAFERLIGHEGGYVFDRRDPGGETKYGISKRAYPNEDIRNLTLERAKEIYHRDYWEAIRAEDLPEKVRFHVFDMAVNAGRKTAIKLLQRAVGVEDHGIYGNLTHAAVRYADPETLLARFSGHRLKYYTDLKTWPTFGKGWTRRVADNLMASS